MEDMEAAFKLCGCRGWLSPIDVCSIQATCKKFSHMGVTWNNYDQLIALDLSNGAAFTWLRKNIQTIKQLHVTTLVSDYGYFLSLGALLTSLHVDSTAAGALGLQDTIFLEGLQQLVTLRIEAPLLTAVPFLPSSLQNLNVYNCRLEALPTQLPPGLTALDCGYCQKLRRLPGLPEGLKELKIGFCKTLTELPQLPRSLTYLDMNRCHNLEVAPDLPTKMQYLDMECCGRLDEEGVFPILPSGLTFLNMSGYRNWALPPGSLPRNLETLKINFWSEMEVLPELPRSIDRLSCSHCNLKTLEGLPIGLTYLNMEYNAGLLQLPEALPSNLEVLRLTGCEQLVVLPGSLPSNLRVLNAVFVPLQHPPELPATLEVLDLSHSTQLRQLPNLAAATGLQDLNISGSPAMDGLRDGPPGLGMLQHLTRLVLSDCRHLTKIDVLPPNVQQLCVRMCPELEHLADLPNGLTQFSISSCLELTLTAPALPASLRNYSIRLMPILWMYQRLPAGLVQLDVSYCEHLLALPEVLPAGLTRLECSGNKTITELPHLPAGLAKLLCDECSKLQRLPALPTKLTELRCSDCPQLEVLPELPTRLQRLECCDCEGLSVLPAVPPALTHLNCSRCTRLQRLPDISSTCMLELNCSGCPELLVPLEQLRTLPPTIYRLDLTSLGKAWTNW